jgi:hypothetical protein
MTQSWHADTRRNGKRSAQHHEVEAHAMSQPDPTPQPADRRTGRQDAKVLQLPTAAARRRVGDLQTAVTDLLTRAQQVLEQEGWAPEGSDGLGGPYSLTEALAAAAFPAGLVDEDQERDREPTRTFAAAWMEVARTSVEELGLTHLQFQADPSVTGHHVVALLECAKLRLQVRSLDPQPA